MVSAVKTHRELENNFRFVVLLLNLLNRTNNLK